MTEIVVVAKAVSAPGCVMCIPVSVAFARQT